MPATDTNSAAGPKSTMAEVLKAYPGAQRALFRRYHIGGCSSCAFHPTETLEDLCRRNNNLNVQEVLDHIQSSHEQDVKIFIEPRELADLLEKDKTIKLVDVRSREEYDAVKLNDSILLSQPVMQEIMGRWPRNQTFVIVDHQGKNALDAAAYFLGHGFENIRCLRGGIDAWSREIDSKMPRYRVEANQP